jgi:hypothetical protein
MAILLVERSRTWGGGKIKLELVGAVKLASAPKTDDSVKGQIYNKDEARAYISLGLVPLSHGQ